MKLKGIILSVLFCSIIGLILQLTGLVLKQWMYAPSVEEVVNGKNMTFYSLRGLWQSYDRVYKFKIAGESKLYDVNEAHASHTFVPAVLDDWFDAVRSLEVIGAVINMGSMISAVFWYFFVGKKTEFLSCSTQQLTFISLILAGILDLLGVTILIGKVHPDLTSWGGALCGFGGTFCIIGASFIRYWQQREYE